MRIVWGTLLLGIVLAGCGGGWSGPSGSAATLGLYPSNGASTSLPAGPGAQSLTFTMRNAITPNGPQAPSTQYLVGEAGYTGPLTATSSCPAGATVLASFASTASTTVAVGRARRGGQDASSGLPSTAAGPAAILNLTASSTVGPPTCTVTVSDALGHAATISVTDQRLLLFPGGTGGGGFSSYQFDAGQFPSAVPVREANYGGAYALQANSCSSLSLQLLTPVDPGSPAVLSIGQTAPLTAFVFCTVTVSDASGQVAELTLTSLPPP